MRRAALTLALTATTLAACGSGYDRSAATAATIASTATPRFTIPAPATPLPHTVAENPLAIHPPVATEARIALKVTGAERFDGTLHEAAGCIVTAEPSATILVQGRAGDMMLSFLIIGPTDGTAPVSLSGGAGPRIDALDVNAAGRAYVAGTGAAMLADDGTRGSLTATSHIAGKAGPADITVEVQWQCG
jgi:hypothetical protein